MAQHFLLTAVARSMSLGKIMRLTDEQAHEAFVAIRFADNGGAAFNCTAVNAYAARRIWECKACSHQFSVTSGTIFAFRKLPVRDYLAAIAIFVNAVKGISALQLGRDLDVHYKTAFVLAHKLREAIAAEQMQGKLSGTVEVDGAYFGGHTRQENKKADRQDRRLLPQPKKQVVAVVRERQGRTLSFVVGKESDAVAIVRERVAAGSIVHADEAPGGTSCAPSMRCTASTTRLRSHWRALAPTRPKATSPASVAPSSASTTISAASTSPPTPLRWRGARIGAGCPTGSSIRQ